MDEPLSNLDAKLRVSMRAEIAKIHRRIGATTIYVTHDQTEAMTLADRIVIMSATKTQLVLVLSDVWNKSVLLKKSTKPSQQICSWIHRKPCYELH